MIGVGVTVGNTVTVGVRVATGTIVTTPPSSDESNWSTSEITAGSLLARISTFPGMSIAKEAIATPAEVFAVDSSCCRINPLLSRVNIVKRTTVSSGTIF